MAWWIIKPDDVYMGSSLSPCNSVHQLLKLLRKWSLYLWYNSAYMFHYKLNDYVMTALWKAKKVVSLLSELSVFSSLISFSLTDAECGLPYDKESMAIIHLNNTTVMYLKEVTKFLAMVCFLRKESFERKGQSIHSRFIDAPITKRLKGSKWKYLVLNTNFNTVGKVCGVETFEAHHDSQHPITSSEWYLLQSQKPSAWNYIVTFFFTCSLFYFIQRYNNCIRLSLWLFNSTPL